MRSIITKAIALLIAFSTATLAQEKGSFTDARDKKKYKTVKIGEQVWMAENLNYNADGSKCYEDKPANCIKYGKLYDWETARKACPAGWHLPRKAEWEKLFSFVDSTGKEAGKHLKAKSGWNKTYDGKSGNGTDNFGFSAIPGGDGQLSGRGDLIFSREMEQGVWWGATENPNANGEGTLIYFRNDDDVPRLVYQNNKFFYRIRCIQGDGEEALKAETEENVAKEKAYAEALEPIRKANGGTFTDTRDKKTYKTIKINGQVWMAENLNYEAESSACYNNKPENCNKYGRMYNWETAMKSCPAGWHLPKNAEWDKLYRSADGTSGTESPYRSKTAGKFLKTANNNGTDKFGFSALLGGLSLNGAYQQAGNVGNWWSASEDGNSAYYSIMTNKDEASYSSNDKRRMFFNIRCIKD